VIRLSLPLVLLVVGAVPATAQAPLTPDSVATQVALGKKLFEGKGLCFSCHGKDGVGVLGPSTRLAGRPLAHVKPSLAEIVALIKSGVDSAHSVVGQPMPPRGGSRLTDSEVAAVAWYVLDLQKAIPPPKP
jgi:mono/diheme cytochrome c family protein